MTFQIQLECNLAVGDEGKPSAHFVWSTDAATPPVEVANTTTRQLVFTVSDTANEGDYTCTPVNSLGSGTPDTITLTVFGTTYIPLIKVNLMYQTFVNL